jgi:hypothetical protein
MGHAGFDSATKNFWRILTSRGGWCARDRAGNLVGVVVVNPGRRPFAVELRHTAGRRTTRRMPGPHRSGLIVGMTDWSQLEHAYGSAENVPALLDRLVPDPSAEVWGDLWSCLCHQATVYPASFAALPRLTKIAGSWAPADRAMILALCGSIVAGARQSHGAGDVRTTYAAEIEELLRLTNESMRTPTEEGTFIYLLQAALAFENVPVWDTMLDALVQGEYELEHCPGCAAHLFVVIGARGFFVASGDYAREDGVPKGELTPTVPSELDDVARRSYDTANDLGQEDLASKLLYLCGNATCPDCGTTFVVIDQIPGEYG